MRYNAAGLFSTARGGGEAGSPPLSTTALRSYSAAGEAPPALALGGGTSSSDSERGGLNLREEAHVPQTVAFNGQVCACKVHAINDTVVSF